MVRRVVGKPVAAAGVEATLAVGRLLVVTLEEAGNRQVERPQPEAAEAGGRHAEPERCFRWKNSP